MKRTKRNPVIEQFKRDIVGMNSSQIIEYANMGSKEREKFLNKFRKERENDINKKGINDIKNKAVPVKIIEPGEVCVMVLNMRGKPMMPTSPGKARMLLKKGKAKVVQRDPFTIQLNYPTGENKQPIILALDPGYKTVGLSAVTNKRELISGEVILRTDIPERLIEKGMYRRGRRNRNTRYRKPRFEGRDVSKGWLAPSIQHKLDTYVRLVNKFDKILPITSINIETSPFDTQKMQNPEISGIEYQHGTLQGYEIKEYLLEKFGRKCVYCGKENVPLETEHIIPPSRGIGGTNRVSNLTIACHDCNQKKDKLTAAEFGHPEVQMMAKKPLVAAVFMNIVRSRLVDLVKQNFPQYQCNETYGYVTKYTRIKMELEKTHANDAFVIAGGKNQIRSKPYLVKQIRRNNRSLQLNKKGSKLSIKRQRYKFKPGDLVKKITTKDIWGKYGYKSRDRTPAYTVKGAFNYGKWVRLENPIQGEKDISINIDDVKIYKYGSGLLFQLAKVKEVVTLTEKSGVKKLNRKEQKEQKMIDTKRQISIEDAWN